MANRNTVKSWFVSRAKPLSTQFFEFFDSIWFKNEQIPIENIAGIDQYFGQLIPQISIDVTEDYVYQIPEGYSIYQIYFKSANDQSIRIGSELGLDDHASDTEIEADKTCPVMVNIPADVATDVYFGGITHPVTIKIYLHKI